MSAAEIISADSCLMEAWPAFERKNLAGWLLRASKGGYGRTNAVWPARFEGGMLDEEIGEAERFYAERGLAPLFQVLERAAPPGLDAVLAKRGYVVAAPCHTMTRMVRSDLGPIGSVELSAEASNDWLSLYLPQQPAAKAQECLDILPRLLRPHAFAVFKDGGVSVSAALGVKVGQDVAIECVLTHPDRRRSGGAAAVTRALERWAREQGASRLVLSVVTDNGPAVALYRSLGFERISGYHYRLIG